MDYQEFQRRIIEHYEWTISEDYDKVKEKLILCPMNYTNNKEELEDVLYEKYDDIALVLLMVTREDEEGLSGLHLAKQYLEIWGKNWEEVYKDALLNTNLRAFPRLYVNLEDSLDMNPERGRFMYGECDVERIDKMQTPVVTTTKLAYGAIAMFYPGVKEKIAELLGGNYFVCFTSVNEAVVHSIGTTSPRRILNSLKELNRNFPESEMLSRKVFIFDAKNRTFKALPFIP